MYRTEFWNLWEKVRVRCFEGTASKYVYYLGWNRSPAQVGCMRQVLGPGALEKSGFFFNKRYTTGRSSSVLPVSRANFSRNIPWWAVWTLLLSLGDDNYRFARVQGWPLTQLAVKPGCNCSGGIMCRVTPWGRSYFSGILVPAEAAHRCNGIRSCLTEALTREGL